MDLGRGDLAGAPLRRLLQIENSSRVERANRHHARDDARELVILSLCVFRGPLPRSPLPHILGVPGALVRRRHYCGWS